MTMPAADWATISSPATAARMLVLVVATFAAVRSSNRSAQIAEAALQEQRRPVLAPSGLEDPEEQIMFLEGRRVSAEDDHAARTDRAARTVGLAGVPPGAGRWRRYLLDAMIGGMSNMLAPGKALRS